LCHRLHELAPELLGNPVVGSTILRFDGSRISGLG
jgi:hypothetical protein